jgi:hypothetical protein
MPTQSPIAEGAEASGPCVLALLPALSVLPMHARENATASKITNHEAVQARLGHASSVIGHGSWLIAHGSSFIVHRSSVMGYPGFYVDHQCATK